jgi:2-keto-3-deoxy-L-rhamnonate aldolase RhmA
MAVPASASGPFQASKVRFSGASRASIRRAVREGRAALGTGLKEFASRGVPWIIEEAGFDYCAIDHEHGAFDMETIANLASWFQATNVTGIPT